MKRMIAVLTAMFLLVTAAFAGMAFAEGEEDVAGEWHIQSMKEGETEVDASMIVSMGMDVLLVLNEDGTVSLNSMQEKLEGTWTFDGTKGVITIDDSPREFTVEEGILTLGDDENIMRFSKEAAEPADVSLAPAVTDPAAEDFNGAWTGTTYVAFGLPMPVALMGAEISVTIEDGSVSLLVNVTSETEDGESESTSMESQFASELQEDGTLYVDFDGEDILGGIGLNGSAAILTLHEDGKISCTTPEIIEGMEMLKNASAESENTGAEEAETVPEGESGGDSAGESGGSSSGSDMDTYLILEKAE